eukprot:15479520-Alexandrium_andersonii.AAC.1
MGSGGCNGGGSNGAHSERAAVPRWLNRDDVQETMLRVLAHATALGPREGCSSSSRACSRAWRT